MDRDQLAHFLRTRREALSPEDVGLTRGPRRRTSGLRREEVAGLIGMSTDYYSRLEQRRGPQPSEQMVAAIARGLRLSLDERDHLFRITGHPLAQRALRTDHVSPGMQRILDRLTDTPAQVMTDLGEVLAQTPPARALLGDRMQDVGLDRSTVHRWFTDPSSRHVYPAEDQPRHARAFVADLRTAYARLGHDSRAGIIVDSLLGRSAEFAAIWADHEVREKHQRMKRLQHPEVGVMDLECQILLDPLQAQQLLVFTAEPGSASAAKLELLAVLGTQRMSTDAPV